MKAYHRFKQGEIKRWKGFLLEAVDGSQVHLPDPTFGSDISRVFGMHRGSPMALVMASCDVLQGIITKAVLCPFRTDERWVAMRWLKNCAKDVLRIYDRGFGAAALMWWHQKFGVQYLMRLKLDFNTQVKAFVKSGLAEQVVHFTISCKAKRFAEKGMPTPVGQMVKVRLIRVGLPNGEIEVLATSLFDPVLYPAAEFAGLYQLRWGDETAFDKLKNTMQLQLFAARKAQGIQQEFQATILLLNLQVLLMQDCQPEVDRKTAKAKHRYKVNQNTSLGHLKDNVVKIFLQDDPEKICHDLKKLFLRQLIPIKPNRSVPRLKRKKHLNTKHFTPVNYRKPF